jgi:hypothetical protein
MAKRNDEINKSEEIRQLLRTNPKAGAKEIVSTLGQRGIKVSENLFYYIKGQLKGRKSRKKKAQKVVTKVAEATGAVRSDVVATIMKVKGLASEVGGMKKLKALVEVLSE